MEAAAHLILILCALVSVYIGVPWFHSRYSRLMLKRRVISAKALVMTFDDGPGSRLTPLILDMLTRNNVKATFFLLGRNIRGRESIVRQIAAAGHEICSHGYNHLHQWKVSPIRAIKDIKYGWQAIDNALGTNRGKYPFRPPYGKLNLFSFLYLWIHKIPICYWTLVSGDTWPQDKRDSQRIASLTRKAGGAVILTHDFDRSDKDVESFVIDSTRSVLKVAQESDMQIITISQLLSGNRG